MKEIRGGLPEKDANRGFWGVSTFFLIVLVLFGFLLCREGTGICETIIGIGAIYLILLCFFIGISRSYVMNEKGIAITFNNFKVWTKMYPWEEYDEIKEERELTEEELNTLSDVILEWIHRDLQKPTPKKRVRKGETLDLFDQD